MIKPRQRPPKNKQVSEPVDRTTEIERLAALDPIDYEAARLQAVGRLGVRASILDREVTKKRRALGLETDDDDGQGRAVKIGDPLPWHEPVDGDQVATALTAAIKTYAVLPDTAADTIAMWVLHTWVVNMFTMSPRLAITSPTKGCGKTTVLRLLNHITRRPKRSGSISPAALFRVIEKFQPTIMLDETEKYIEHGSDLHALLNEGHAQGGSVMRVLEKKLELREFSLFGAVAFARNGPLPDDLEQRSIIIEMQRRRAHEELAELRDDRAESLQQFARMCCRWADDNGHLLADHDPDMGMINRNADNWRPLFAIADIIGADWPERIREAAAVLAPRESESIGPMLLGDIRTLFEEKQADRIGSADMADTLAAIEGRPWAEWGKAKKPLTKNQLAGLLKPFHIISDSVRIGDRTPKGYYLNQFAEAFERYLPRVPFETQQRNNANGAGTSCAFRNATPEACCVSERNTNPDVAVQKHEKPAPDGACCVVAFEKGGNGLDEGAYPHFTEAEAPEVSEDRSCRHCDGTLDGSERLYQINGTSVWLHPECRRFFVAEHNERASQ
jgi:putative DNA primase/helicase